MFTLQSWTLSDEQDLDLGSTAPSSCSPPLQSASLCIPLRSVKSTEHQFTSTKVQRRRLALLSFNYRVNVTKKQFAS